MLRTPGPHLLLCGQSVEWDHLGVGRLVTAYTGALTVHRVTAPRLAGRRPDQPAHYLVRPDGHVAYRAAGTDLTGVTGYLATWLQPQS